uniref:Uncharacterized protein n=1 Tax=Mycena chlorophos TaxID=658473 RepID=A0ABQ0M0H5_MYCCL|nr:predicted protein [Mycena chlorophos]
MTGLNHSSARKDALTNRATPTLRLSALNYDLDGFPAHARQPRASPPAVLLRQQHVKCDAVQRPSSSLHTLDTAYARRFCYGAPAGDSAVVAKISRKSILPDTVSFPAAPDEGSGDAREVKTSKWLKKCKLADGTQAHAFDTEIGQCLLRRHLQYRLALFTEFDTETPIAHWEKGSSPPSLLISSSVPEAFHPQVICAFIIEEFKMRMAEKADVIAQGKALAQSTPLARIR